jgi:hypothetical protein
VPAHASPVPFPRGVADTAGRRGFLRDGAGRIVALDLGTGALLWRSPMPMRPLLAREDRLLAVRPLPPHALQVVALASDGGDELCASPPIALPDWTKPSVEDTPEFMLGVHDDGGTLVLRWMGRARYRGGAAPAAKVLESAKRDASGLVRVDVATCRIEEVGDAPHDAGTAPAAAGIPSAEPEVIEQHDIGGRRFQLRAHPTEAGTSRLLARALDAATGRVEWESAIDETGARRPRPPRP